MLCWPWPNNASSKQGLSSNRRHFIARPVASWSSCDLSVKCPLVGNQAMWISLASGS